MLTILDIPDNKRGGKRVNRIAPEWVGSYIHYDARRHNVNVSGRYGEMIIVSVVDAPEQWRMFSARALDAIDIGSEAEYDLAYMDNEYSILTINNGMLPVAKIVSDVRSKMDLIQLVYELKMGDAKNEFNRQRDEQEA